MGSRRRRMTPSFPFSSGHLVFLVLCTQNYYIYYVFVHVLFHNFYCNSAVDLACHNFRCESYKNTFKMCVVG